MTIAATTSIDAAMDQLWHAVVVGAGPAGSVAARELARCGRAVLLIDKSAFPRGKVCGCCLSGVALETLRSIGLGHVPAEQGAIPLKNINLAAGKSSAKLNLGRGVSLSRHRLDAALVEQAIAAGAHFLPETPVTRVWSEADLRCVKVRHSRPIRCRIVVAADGLNGRALSTATESVPLSRIGAGAVAPHAPDFFQPGTVYMACARTGYVGLVRLEDHQLDIGAALAPEAVRSAGLAGAVQEILSSTGWPAIPALAELPWRGTPALTRRKLQIADHRLFAVGDATGYVEPFTGEGIAWAVGSAVALSKIANKAIQRWDPRWQTVWTSTHHRLVARRQYLCQAMAWMLRSPRLTRWLVKLLSIAPVLARPYLYHLNHRWANGS